MNVLFLCGKNSAQSVMAEALLKRFGGERFHAFSAGIQPADEIDALTRDTLKAGGMEVPIAKPRSFREFLAPSAPPMDMVIGLSKEAATVLEDWPGHPFKAKWGITVPPSDSGDALEQRKAFRRACRELENRIRLFVLLPHRPSAGLATAGVAQAQNA